MWVFILFWLLSADAKRKNKCEYKSNDTLKYAFRHDYGYVLDTEGYFKFHDAPTGWHDAQAVCLLEGATIASPFNDHVKQVFTYFLSKLKANNILLYTGFTSIRLAGEYIDLVGRRYDDIPHSWAAGEPNMSTQLHNAVALDREGSSHAVDLDKHYPFLCYKKHSADINETKKRECSISDNGYVMYSNYSIKACYKFHKNKQTWEQARATCFGEGGHLPYIRGYYHRELLKNITIKPFSGDAFFAGYYRNKNTKEWLTIFEQPLAEAGYEEIEGKKLSPHDCLGFNRRAILVNLDCKKEHPYFCEINWDGKRWK